MNSIKEIYWLCGDPGSGKTFASNLLKNKKNIYWLPVSKILEKTPSLFSNEIDLVNDVSVIQRIQIYLYDNDAKDKYTTAIVDGFPRTPAQAEIVVKFKESHVVYMTHSIFKLEDVWSILKSRGKCKKCNKTFILKNEIETVCKICGGDIKQREGSYEDFEKRALESRAEFEKIHAVLKNNNTKFSEFKIDPNYLLFLYNLLN